MKIEELEEIMDSLVAQPNFHNTLYLNLKDLDHEIINDWGFPDPGDKDYPITRIAEDNREFGHYSYYKYLDNLGENSIEITIYWEFNNITDITIEQEILAVFTDISHDCIKDKRVIKIW